MKKIIIAAMPAALALSACSQGTEPADQESSTVVTNDDDVADPDDDAAVPAAEEHGDDHAHDGEDADHAH
ncbi:MAG: membrane lipoprotein lipid attachment site-containing protein [Alphaproteobacteria bacterium]|nr:membrane lipoprotein lipid attachment site-containing protein [Alphaproteobacteria bacterium]MBU0877625.1 membrane lipoprotein lipid attachment site-containing protein [Alphaproteobacteria bacterium]MBU1770137.1 membrane lipoprotein lipid attachment site-containing protein [Alphaproteobacteria bacterium]